MLNYSVAELRIYSFGFGQTCLFPPLQGVLSGKGFASFILFVYQRIKVNLVIKKPSQVFHF